jgi:hypothetical protein
MKSCNPCHAKGHICGNLVVTSVAIWRQGKGNPLEKGLRPWSQNPLQCLDLSEKFELERIVAHGPCRVTMSSRSDCVYVHNLLLGMKCALSLQSDHGVVITFMSSSETKAARLHFMTQVRNPLNVASPQDPLHLKAVVYFSYELLATAIW